MKILVTPTSLGADSTLEAMRVLRNFADELVFNPYGRPLTSEELIPLLQDCDGYLAGLDQVTAEALQRAERLKVVSRYGVGYDRVDLDAARRCGIVVTNTPGANSRAVAELAFGLILALARKIPSLNEETQKGAWLRSTGCELYGKTLGIVGLGAVGRLTAEFGRGFGMRVMAYDPYVDLSYCEAHNIRAGSFDELIQSSDVISLHIPRTPETYHIINQDSLRKMKMGAILVNTARGGLIDEAAAVDALDEGRLSGIGMDAFEEEPPVNSPLFRHPNVVMTPHTGAHTKEAVEKMAMLSVENLIKVLRGESCKYMV